HSRFIRARAPDVVPRHDGLALLALVLIIQRGLALRSRRHRRWSIGKNRSTFHGRTAVSDGNVGHADSLHHAGLLARANGFDLQWRLLREGGGRRQQNCETETRKSFNGNHWALLGS